MHASHDANASLDRLDIALLADGGVELKQGDTGCCDICVTLHPAQLDLLASMAGYVRSDEVARACERLNDRLHLLAAMIEAHTAPGHPLRAAVTAIAPEHASASTGHHEPPAWPESAPCAVSDPTEAAMDLFAEPPRAG